MRLDRLFQHRLLLTPIASYVGLAALCYSVWGIGAGVISAAWLIALVVGTLGLLFGVTVGLHRLFCHASFKTSSLWHVVLAWLGTLAVYGSSVQWAAMHASHHKYSDTDKDPHYTGWRYLLWKKNRPTIFNKRVLTRLYRQPLHRFLHKYYVLVLAATIMALWLIDWRLLVVGYLAPLGWLHLVGSAHQVLAHDENGARDQRWLEWILFTGGEWLHKWHHDHPRDACFGKSDLGWRFIQLIQR